MQLVGIFMAFHTRKIKIKVLNDSKEITAIIYINSITLIVLAITEFGLQSYINVYHAVFGLVLLIEATMLSGIVFIPKVSIRHYFVVLQQFMVTGIIIYKLLKLTNALFDQ